MQRQDLTPRRAVSDVSTPLSAMLNNGTRGGGLSQRPRQSKRACVICHSRKVRCDGADNGFPCTNCKDADLQCTVAERRKRKRAAPRRALDHTRLSLTEAPSLQQKESDPITLEDSAAATPETTEPPSRNELVAEGEEGQDASERELAKQHLVGFFSQDLQRSPIRARLTYVGNELSNLNYLTRQRALDHHVYHYPCDNPYVPRVYKSARPPETADPIHKDAFILPPKHIADVLVEAFFESIHPTFPVIDKEGFLKRYHDPRLAPSLLLLQAVCLAGAHAVKVFKNNQELKVALFRRAKALLQGRYEEDRMEMVQAALLLTWFSDGGDDVCANAWWWIGIAARTAIGLGMHREVGPSRMPEIDKRTWRRMWWCLVQFDCIVSLCYGRSQNINLDDCDVPPLRRDDFEESAEQGDVDFVMQHAALCAIVSDLMRSHFTVKATKSPTGRKQALETLDAQLAEWFMGLPSELRDISGGHRTGDSASPNALLLHLTYNAVLAQFHRLLIKRDSDDAFDNESRAHEEICAEAAANVLQIFELLTRQGNLHRCWFAAPSFLFTAMLQARSQLRSTNPILALKARAKENSGLKSLRGLSRHWLFATSVWRLFRSNSIATVPVNKPSTPKPADANAAAEGVSPGQASSVATASSMLLVPVTSSRPEEEETYMAPNTGHSYSGQAESMDWIQLPGPNDAAPVNMYTDQDRLQQSLSEWQSTYWSDPLADLSLSHEMQVFSSHWAL